MPKRDEMTLKYCECKRPFLAEADKPTFHHCYNCNRLIKNRETKMTLRPKKDKRMKWKKKITTEDLIELIWRELSKLMGF